MQAGLYGVSMLRHLRPPLGQVPCVPHVVSKPAVRPLLRCKAEGHSLSNEVPDPANSIVTQPSHEAQPLVTQFEAERNDDDRETFVTAEGLVEEIEEEDAKVF